MVDRCVSRERLLARSCRRSRLNERRFQRGNSGAYRVRKRPKSIRAGPSGPARRRFPRPREAKSCALRRKAVNHRRTLRRGRLSPSLPVPKHAPPPMCVVQPRAL
jgi:hypothetical protein